MDDNAAAEAKIVLLNKIDEVLLKVVAMRESVPELVRKKLKHENTHIAKAALAAPWAQLTTSTPAETFESVDKVMKQLMSQERAVKQELKQAKVENQQLHKRVLELEKIARVLDKFAGDM